MFENKSDHMKLALKENIRKMKMEKGDTIQKYMTKFTQCRDELGGANVIVGKDDMAILSLLVLPKSCHNYQDLVNVREKLLEWERLWSGMV